MLAGQRRGSSNRSTVPSPVSPLVASFNEWAFGRPAAVLPRPPETFQIGSFGPDTPLIPMPVDEPDQTGIVEPRRTQYPVAWNLPVGVPGSEGLGKLASFNTLRAMADKYSVVRAALNRRIQEITGLDWDVVPTKDAEHAMKGSATYRTDWQKRHVEMMKFWERPDRAPDSPYFSWEEWAIALFEDALVCDAVGIYLHPPVPGAKGWFGSSVASLDLLDGTTFRPLYAMSGGLPAPSAVAYQQFLWGVPRSDFATIAEGRDKDELPDYVDTFASAELLYARTWPRTWSPYGFSAIEQALLPIAIGYARQTTQLEFFTEGCYDDQTEVLTQHRGWVRFSDLRPDDPVATRSAHGVFEWQLPTEHVRYEKHEDLLHFRSKTVDAMVTKGHRMLVTAGTGVTVRHAAEVASGDCAVPNTASWVGVEPEEVFTVPAIPSNRSERSFVAKGADLILEMLESCGHESEPIYREASRRGLRRHHVAEARKALRIPIVRRQAGRRGALWGNPSGERAVIESRSVSVEIEAWAEFLGLYVAEGCSDRREIHVSQRTWNSRYPEVERVLKATGLPWWRYDANSAWHVSSTALAAWLDAECGHGALNKRIPDCVKEWPPRLIELFLHGFWLGDGSYSATGRRRFHTSSSRLADDLQEVLLKIGFGANVNVATRGHAHPAYTLCESPRATRQLPRPEPVRYDGFVYCVSVPNTIILTRRNGKMLWCGNTVPYTYVVPGPDLVNSPQQIRQLQNALNAISGDTGWKQKVVVLPPGSKTEAMKPFTQSSQFDYLISTYAIMPFGLTPSDLGMVPNMGSGTSGFSYESARMVESGQSNAQDRWLEPFVTFWGRQFNRIIRQVFGQTDMEWHWTGLEQGENADDLINQQSNLLKSSIITIDEARSELGLDTFGADWSQIPLAFSTAGVSLITDAINQGAAEAEIAGETTGGSPTAGSGSPVPVTVGEDRRGQPTVPSHDAARNVESEAHPRPHNDAGKNPIKAVMVELDLLGRLLKKGRTVESFETSVLPVAVLDAVSRALPDVDDAIAAGMLAAAQVVKSGPPHAAGLVVRAADTGRVLMVQRSVDNHNERAAGLWEWPGGRLEDGEDAFVAACREWTQEVGVALPEGKQRGVWQSKDGRYEAFVWVIPHESDIELENARGLDGTGDREVENVAWWDPADLPGNPAVRPEVQTSDWSIIEHAKKVVLPKARAMPWHFTNEIDLRLAAHYEPLIKEALEASVGGLRRAIETAISAADIVPKGPNSPLNLVNRIVHEVVSAIARSLPSKLTNVIKRLWADSWLAGVHSASTHQTLPVPDYLAEIEQATDWANWGPGNADPVLRAAGRGLAQLLSDAGVVIKGVDDTTLRRLGDAIAEGIKQGESVKVLTGRVEGVLGETWRAETIARTEVARAMAAADFEMFRMAGATEWDWVDQPGACPICVANAAGSPYPMGGGPALPAHPNCRCVCEAVLEAT